MKYLEYLILVLVAVERPVANLRQMQIKATF